MAEGDIERAPEWLKNAVAVAAAVRCIWDNSPPPMKALAWAGVTAVLHHVGHPALDTLSGDLTDLVHGP